MTYENFIALLLFAFVTSITPGPNNTMLLASGVNFGLVRSLPHMFGINGGFFTLLVGIGLGLGALIAEFPLFHLALKVAGGGYMLWIAWKIATSRSLSPAGSAGPVPMTFLQAAAFQWINPKAWVMAITAMSAYADPNRALLSVVLIGIIFALTNLPCIFLWVGGGSAMRGWLSDPVRLKWFNITMAGLLIISLWPLLK